jgi:hypothetical protein
MRGKNITIPKGAEITAYVEGDTPLDAQKFLNNPQSHDAPPAPAPASSPSPAPPETPQPPPAAGNTEGTAPN